MVAESGGAASIPVNGVGALRHQGRSPGPGGRTGAQAEAVVGWGVGAQKTGRSVGGDGPARGGFHHNPS